MVTRIDSYDFFEVDREHVNNEIRPEINLLVAYLADALKSLKSVKSSTNPMTIEKAVRTLNWVDGAYNSGLSFEATCDALDFDSEDIREGLYEILKNEETLEFIDRRANRIGKLRRKR